MQEKQARKRREKKQVNVTHYFYSRIASESSHTKAARSIHDNGVSGSKLAGLRMSVFSLRTPVSGEPDNPFHISRILEILRAEITAATMSMTVSRAVITLNHLQFSLSFLFCLGFNVCWPMNIYI